MTIGPNPGSAPVLPAVRRSLAPLREQALEQLRQAIIAGRLAPGSRLIERELIEMLGVSRTVIREALRQLESEGLIGSDTKKGVVVRELTPAEARDLYAIRGLLEGLAARRFVEHAGDEQIGRLTEALRDTVSAYKEGDPAVILATKNRLYRCLFDGSRSETLSSMLGLLHARISRWRALGLGHPRRSAERSKESVRALRSLLAAVKARDAERAETIMRHEASRAAAEVMRLLEQA